MNEMKMAGRTSRLSFSHVLFAVSAPSGAVLRCVRTSRARSFAAPAASLCRVQPLLCRAGLCVRSFSTLARGARPRWRSAAAKPRAARPATGALDMAGGGRAEHRGLAARVSRPRARGYRKGAWDAQEAARFEDSLEEECRLGRARYPDHGAISKIVRTRCVYHVASRLRLLYRLRVNVGYVMPHDLATNRSGDKREGQ